MELVIGMTIRYINKKNREKIGVIETDLNEKKYIVLSVAFGIAYFRN